MRCTFFQESFRHNWNARFGAKTSAIRSITSSMRARSAGRYVGRWRLSFLYNKRGDKFDRHVAGINRVE